MPLLKSVAGTARYLALIIGDNNYLFFVPIFLKGAVIKVHGSYPKN